MWHFSVYNMCIFYYLWQYLFYYAFKITGIFWVPNSLIQVIQLFYWHSATYVFLVLSTAKIIAQCFMLMLICNSLGQNNNFTGKKIKNISEKIKYTCISNIAAECIFFTPNGNKVLTTWNCGISLNWIYTAKAKGFTNIFLICWRGAISQACYLYYHFFTVTQRETCSYWRIIYGHPLYSFFHFQPVCNNVNEINDPFLVSFFRE